MPLIKARDTADLTSQLPTQGHMEASVTIIIERARQDASRIIASALEESRAVAAEIHENARREGYEAGLLAGRETGRLEGSQEAREEMRSQLEHLVESWSSLLEKWSDAEAARLDETARLSLRMSLALSERLVHRQVEVDPSVVIDQIRNALELAQSPADLEIVVADSDRHRVHKALPGLLERFENMGYVSIRGSDTMAAGGCQLQMRGGEVDASLESQLQRLAEAILPCDQPISDFKDACDGEAA